MNSNKFLKVYPYKRVLLSNVKELSSLTAWIIFQSKWIADLVASESFNAFATKLSEAYVQRTKSGEIIPAFTYLPQYVSSNDFAYKGGEIARLVENSDATLYFLRKKQYPFRKLENGGYACGDSSFNCIIPLIGPWYGSISGERLFVAFQLDQNFTANEIWRVSGLCEICGGSFKGVFNKKCSCCGLPKTY